MINSIVILVELKIGDVILVRMVRQYRNLSLDNKQAYRYNEFSRKYRMEDYKEYARLAANLVSDGNSILDVATGPGYFCIELARLGNYRVVGLDISKDLTALARDNALLAGLDVDYLQGDAARMQFSDGSFELVFCSWAIKNFMEPAKVLAEMYRVLKPGGTALIVDLNHAATGAQWKRYISIRQIKGMTAFAMRMAFYIQRHLAYSKTEFSDLIDNTPFRTCYVQDMGVNLCLCLSK